MFVAYTLFFNNVAHLSVKFEFVIVSYVQILPLYNRHWWLMV